MLLLQAFFLWLLVSTLMIGGAMVFHRRFPEESPWFGFIVPPLVFVLLMNFTEHFIALPTLLILLPVFLGGTIWLAVAKGWFTSGLYLPTAVFLVAFAFTFGVRCLRPDISNSSDGISDLNMVNSYSQGQTLPPPDCWLPPFRFEWYYGLQHYAASVLGRILDVKVGVAYNVSHGLLSALICVAASGAAWRFSGGSVWVTLAMLLLIESSATGTTAYLILTSNNHDLWLPEDLSSGITKPPDGNPIWGFLAQTNPYPIRLQVPGFWTWRDEYHANASGHLLSILSAMVIAELSFSRRTLWPWVLAAIIPLLAALASAWALPITALLCWGILPLALVCGRLPVRPGFTAMVLFGALTLLWPAFYNVTSTPEFPEIHWGIPPEEKASLHLFLVQWWPILTLWVAALFCFRQLSFGSRWIMLIVPVMLIGIEQVDIESRYNMIEKMWGDTWGVGLVCLFPIVATRFRIGFRFVTLAIFLSAVISLYGFVRDVAQPSWDHSAFNLEGNGLLRFDEPKKKILRHMTQVKQGTFLSGKTAWCYNDAPTPAVFTGNRSYVAWTTFESLVNFRSEVDYRMKLNDDFYSGALPNRLKFLRDNNIAGVVIWPDDAIADDFLATLRTELEPSYEYVDCKGTGAQNAGLFLLRPFPVK